MQATTVNNSADLVLVTTCQHQASSMDCRSNKQNAIKKSTSQSVILLAALALVASQNINAASEPSDLETSSIVNKLQTFGLIKHKFNISLCNPQLNVTTAVETKNVLACQPNEQLSIISYRDPISLLINETNQPSAKDATTRHYQSQSSLKLLCAQRYKRISQTNESDFTKSSTTRTAHAELELIESKFVNSCVELITTGAKFAFKLGELCNKRQACDPSHAIETSVDCSHLQVEQVLPEAEITYVCVPDEFSTSTIEYRDLSKTITCPTDSLMYVRRCSLKVDHNDRHESTSEQPNGEPNAQIQVAARFWLTDNNETTESLGDFDDYPLASTINPLRARRTPKMAACKALQFVSIIVAENCHGHSHCSIRLTKVIDQSVKFNLCDIKEGKHPLMQSSAEIEYTCINKNKLTQTELGYFEYSQEGTINSEAIQSEVKLIHELGYFSIDEPQDKSASGASSSLSHGTTPISGLVLLAILSACQVIVATQFDLQTM